MPRPISAVEATPVRVVIVTLDNHLSAVVDGASKTLAKDLPEARFTMHATAEWDHDSAAIEACKADIAQGDIIIVSMLFLESHIQAIMPALQARREECDAMVCMMSAGEVIKLTRIGQFRMDGSKRGPLALLKRLRGSKSKNGTSSGQRQMAMLKRIPKILRFIPGTAQDVRAYFLALQYWLAGTEDNITNLARYLIDRYAAGPRQHLRGTMHIPSPIAYPDVGLYHPDLPTKLTEVAGVLPGPQEPKGTVGLILMRSYLLAGNTAHYDGVIAALEARGLRVIPAFASGLDARPAINKFFIRDGRPIVDTVISLTGFSLVGGPAYNDAKAAEDILADLDTPYIACHAIEFQTLQQWAASDRGLMPVESTIMVAIPELDGAIQPTIFGGRFDPKALPESESDQPTSKLMRVCPERAEMIADRALQLIALRRSEQSERKVAVVLFNFPPNAGNIGTAAFLSVFQSLFNVLKQMKEAGYTVDMPASVDDLREKITIGNAGEVGADANVHCRIAADDHVRRERWLSEIEDQWGPAPGRHQTDGGSIFVLGAQFGNVFVGIQPALGYEGDPMRMLFEHGLSPTHAFSAFYRWIREDFDADAVLHFGTHGSLEFMPGKQTGLSSSCWPERLIGDLPNFYLYASNNPSEGMIAKRRSAATLISYMTPPLAKAGLYRGLIDLKSSIDRWRKLDRTEVEDRQKLVELIRVQAAELDLTAAEDAIPADTEAEIAQLQNAILELEYTLIPHGLHVVGDPMSQEQRADMLEAVAESAHGVILDRDDAVALSKGQTPKASIDPEIVSSLSTSSRLLSEEHEVSAILHALDGGFIRPTPGGDLVRTPAVLPTGRNIHGFDPFRIPSPFAMTDGARQAERLLERYLKDNGSVPATAALVLWGTDNLKTEGSTIAQAFALLGARPRFDSFGRLSGAELIPLDELGRPRIDVVMTLSGIFRDLLPLQTKVLAEAAYLAAEADEPLEMNAVRRHALAYADQQDCDLEDASLRVFSNADGAYGSNVNLLIDTGMWTDEDELADTYTSRKSFAYGRSGKPVARKELLNNVLSHVDLAYQNLDSVELGVTTIDHYFDTLGGISRAVSRNRERTVPVYIGDQTRGEGKIRTLSEQVALETRTRMLNPKWYEGMLDHGYEGVRQIEAHITNTFAWSATTGQVAPWVYQQLTETFVLDAEMRERMAKLNPTASAKMANRLLEAHERDYWSPGQDTLDALRQAGEQLEDRLEGVGVEAAA